MRIGIDGTLLRGQDAGTLRIFEHLLQALASTPGCPGRDEVIFFADQAVLPQHFVPDNPFIKLSNVPSNKLLPGALRQQFYRGWNRAGSLDLLHSIGFVPPIGFHGKKVMTLFDLTPFRFPQTQAWTGRLWWKLFSPAGIRRADHILALSESTRSDVIRLFHVPATKVTVIYPYISPQFSPIQPARQVALQYGLSDPYILYVGTLEPRKNLTTLVQAYALAREEWNLTLPLVIAGKKGWLYSEILEAVARFNLQDHVKFLGYVPDKDLPALYSAADLFIYLSIYEGFGLPVMEAMACGAPALIADIPVLAEVAGEAAVRVPPRDVKTIAHEIGSLLTQPDRRLALKQKGFERCSLFTMQRFIRETLDIYRQVTQMPFGTG